MYKFKGRKHKSFTPDLSVNNDKEAKITNKDERFDSDNKRNILPCQHPTKRLLCKVKKKLIKKCCMDISSYISSKPRQSQPTSSYLTSFQEGDTNNDGAINLAGGKSQMAVIYKEQNWKSEIVEEKVRTWKTSQTISRSIKTILGRQQLFYCANIATKLERKEESVKKVGTVLKILIN